jgi:hypothetical protein
MNHRSGAARFFCFVKPVRQKAWCWYSVWDIWRIFPSGKGRGVGILYGIYGAFSRQAKGVVLVFCMGYMAHFPVRQRARCWYSVWDIWRIFPSGKGRGVGILYGIYGAFSRQLRCSLYKVVCLWYLSNMGSCCHSALRNELECPQASSGFDLRSPATLCSTSHLMPKSVPAVLCDCR